MELTASQVKRFERDGFIVMPHFFSDRQCLRLRARAAELEADILAEHRPRVVFSPDDHAHGADSWFLDSGDKIRGFFEADGTHLNKIGHALHDLDPLFDRFSRQTGFAEIAAGIDCEDPRLVQSMYIFKHTGVGAEVTWHTDHSFLWTEPRSVIGFWVAIDDATVHNGCLWVIAGGHKMPVRSRFLRHGDTTTTEVYDDSPFPLERAVPVEAKRGTLVLLDGALPHWSDVNNSDDPRNAFTLHIVDGTAHWDEHNWLQRPTMPFQGFRRSSP